MTKIIALSKKLAILLYIFVFATMMFLAGFLSIQYIFSKREIQEFIQIKESYDQYVDMLRRSLNASLSDNNLETEDEPGDFDSVVKNECIDSDIHSNDIRSAVIEAEPSNETIGPAFDLITPEEENRLGSIKQTVQKLKARRKPKINNQKQLRRMRRASLSKNTSRCIPECDFVFAWPIDLPNFWLSSLYGLRRFSNGKVSFHHGIDMASMKGTAVKAAAAGKILCAQWVSGYGNCIEIGHDDHFKTRYAHLNTIRIRVGSNVQAGQFIGTVGDTGFVRKSGKDASHLHFEIHHDGHSINPLKFLFI